jgi:hypothetical protein
MPYSGDCWWESVQEVGTPEEELENELKKVAYIEHYSTKIYISNMTWQGGNSCLFPLWNKIMPTQSDIVQQKEWNKISTI